MMEIRWQSGVRIHSKCGGEVAIGPDGYICTGCGEQSANDTLSNVEQERERRDEEEAQESERDEFEREEWDSLNGGK